MEVRRHPDAEGLLAAAGRFLVSREAEHNLVLGICTGLSEGHFDPAEAYLASVHAAGRVAVVAVRTPPHNLVLCVVDDVDALAPLADDVASAHGELPGVSGPKGPAARFAHIWQDRTAQRPTRGMAMRIHKAERITPPSGVPGGLRPADARDLDLLTRWGREFQQEALGEEPTRQQARDWVQRLVEDTSGGAVLWEHEEPVSMAAYGGPTPNGIRIFAVYTPVPLRGHGYASACVAALSADLLRRGRRFCFLFTDLANPVSNRLYHRIGYQPVADVDEYRFEGRPKSVG